MFFDISSMKHWRSSSDDELESFETEVTTQFDEENFNEHLNELEWSEFDNDSSAQSNESVEKNPKKITIGNFSDTFLQINKHLRTKSTQKT